MITSSMGLAFREDIKQQAPQSTLDAVHEEIMLQLALVQEWMTKVLVSKSE